MFDTYEYRAGDEHHHHRSEVHEHRAPTDASVALLKEMERAALDKILDTVRLDGSPVDCVIFRHRDLMEDTHKFIIRYKIGRHERDVRHDFRSKYGASMQETNAACMEELMAALADDIAHNLLSDAFVQLLKRNGFNLN